MRRILFVRFIVVVVLVSLFLISCSKDNDEKEEIKVGFLYSNTIGDVGWTYEHNVARLELLNEDYISSAPYIESLESDDSTEIAAKLNQLVDQGCKIIFSTSFDFMNPTLAVANANPNIYFMNCGGYKTADNMGTYFARIHQPDYLVGLLAAEYSNNDSIGYVAPIRIPEVYRGINAFAIGVLERKPDAKIFVKWVNKWDDPVVEREKALELINLGVDVLAQGQVSPEVNIVADENGLPSFGYNSDMSSYAPGSHITAPMWNWIVLYKHFCKMVYEKEWQVEETWWGYERDAVKLSPFAASVTSDLRTMVENRITEFKNSAFVVFKGPLYTNTDSLVYAEGIQATDPELLSMEYLIRGVIEP